MINCNLCNSVYPKFCNKCNNTERCLAWPTAWVHHEGDIMEISELRKLKPNYSCYTVFIDSNGVFFPDDNIFTVFDELNITEGYLVTVDYHQ